MTLREALTRAADQLSAHPDLRGTALPDAAALLMHALSLTRVQLLAHPEAKMEREDQARYQRLIEQRLAFTPIQYITGMQDFYGLALRVTPAVLIPRPETELVVEAVLARLPAGQPLRVLDVGTGSGAIAIAIAIALPLALVTAVDLFSAALDVARENARTHGVEGRIRFVESDLLGAIVPGEWFDAIVSNPPYVPDADAASLHPQVREHEPAGALFAGVEGLDIYRRLIPQAAGSLKPGGLLALEIGYGQGDAVRELLSAWDKVEVLPDLQRIPRVVLARSGRN